MKDVKLDKDEKIMNFSRCLCVGQRKEKDNMTSQITVGRSTTVRTNQGMSVRTNLSG